MYTWSEGRGREKWRVVCENACGSGDDGTGRCGWGGEGDRWLTNTQFFGEVIFKRGKFLQTPVSPLVYKFPSYQPRESLNPK